MHQKLPEYFYLAHINTKNPLAFQKVLNLAISYFSSRSEGSQVSKRDFPGSNFVLAVTSPTPLAHHLTGAFENLWDDDPEVRFVFSHSTSSFAGDKSLPTKPTYVYSTVLFLKEYEDSASFFKWNRFKKAVSFLIWDFTNAKTHYDKDQNEIQVFIESQTPLNSTILTTLKGSFVSSDVKYQTTYQNF